MIHNQARPTMQTVFQLDLSDALPGEIYWVQALGKRHGIVPHTEQTRAEARSRWPSLDAVPDHRLTHYTENPVTMPADRAVRVHVKHTLKTCAWARAEYGVGNAAIHVPCLPSSNGIHCQYINYVTTAKTLVFHHPDLICVDPVASCTICSYMDNDEAISLMFETLGGMMRDMGPPTESSGWATLELFTPPENPETGFNGTTSYYYTVPSDDVITAAGPVMTAMMKATKNDLSLQGKKWTQQTGQSVKPVSPASEVELGRVNAGGDDWQPALQSTDEISGLTAAITVLDASTQHLQLSLTNTYIRYLSAYIQFLDSAGNPISVPDWKPDGDQDLIVSLFKIQYDNLRYLGHIGPMNNVMAIPCPPEGNLTVSFTFPAKATSAVIYGSGLGTGADDYPLTPLVGGLLTGLLNLSVPSCWLRAQRPKLMGLPTPSPKSC